MKHQSRFWNMMIGLVVLIINVSILVLWIQILRGIVWPELHGAWWFTGKILVGWWLTGVIASVIYDGETYAWDSVSSTGHQVIPPLFIVTIPLEKLHAYEKWNFYWRSEALLGGPLHLLVALALQASAKVPASK